MNLQTSKPAPGDVLRPTRKEASELVGDGDLAVQAGNSGLSVRQIVAAIAQLLLVIALVALAAMIYMWLMSSAPVAERSARERVARLVEVAPVTVARQGPVITAWGEVQAAQTLIVRPEIAGRLEWVHPDVAPGGLLTAGTVVARLDSRDLRLAKLRAEADIADIQARILIEEGQATLGERELTRLSRNITATQRALVRREPQMAQLKAELSAARATLEQAENAIERSVVVAPFNVLVLTESVAPGTMLSAGMEAATLAASDQFEVTLYMPARYLEWIVSDGTQEVRLTQPGVWPEGAARTGRIVRLGAGLSETGRMVELVVAVQDPLALLPDNLGQPRLLLGSFLKGTIVGQASSSDAPNATGPDMLRLDRAHLRDGDTVWVMNAEDKLEIRDLAIVWRGPDAVLVTSGVAEGDRIITTRLAAFAPGMALRTGNNASKTE